MKIEINREIILNLIKCSKRNFNKIFNLVNKLEDKKLLSEILKNKDSKEILNILIKEKDSNNYNSYSSFKKDLMINKLNDEEFLNYMLIDPDYANTNKPNS